MYKTIVDGQPALVWCGLEPVEVDVDKIVRKTLLIASACVLVVTLIVGAW